MVNLNTLLNTVQKNKQVLSRDEEIELGTIIQSSLSTEYAKHNAIENLVLNNIRLVVKICHKYKRKEFEFEDLVGYGILGLFTAARKYNPTHKNRFASYARYWIKDAVIKAIREYSGLPKIPVYLVKNLWGVSRILSKDDTINDATLAERGNVSEKDARYLRSLMFKFVQFDVSYTQERPSNNPENLYSLKERNKLIYFTLHKVLTDDEFTVLAHTHELCGYVKIPLVRIESELNIKNPRKLKIGALEKLRNSSILQSLYKEGIMNG